MQLRSEQGAEDIQLTNDGEGTDVQADDKTWTGTAWVEGDIFQVTLTTGEGVRDGGAVSWASTVERRDLILILGPTSLAAQAEEAPLIAPPSAPATAEGGLPPSPERSMRDPGGRQLTTPLVLGLLFGLAWLLKRLRDHLDDRAVRALVEPRPLRIQGLDAPLAPDSFHELPEGVLAKLADHLISCLAISGPVVILASPDGALESVGVGSVFPYRGRTSNLPRTMRALAARSLVQPVLVVVLDPADPELFELISNELPDAVCALFVVRSAEGMDSAARFSWTREGDVWCAHSVT